MGPLDAQVRASLCPGGSAQRPPSRAARFLPASISWHCCPKTWEKVTGPVAEPGAASVDSMAPRGSLTLVMWRRPDSSECPSKR